MRSYLIQYLNMQGEHFRNPEHCCFIVNADNYDSAKVEGLKVL